MRLLTLKTMVVAVVIATSSVADAQWELIDDFEALALGAVGGQGGWTTTLGSQTSTTSRTVVVDPTDAANQALELSLHNPDGGGGGSGQINSYISLGEGLNDGTTGTVFFRMRGTDLGHDAVFGPSEDMAPAGFGAFRAHMRFSADGMDGRFSSGWEEVDTYDYGEWYNIWSVIDNTADTWTMYASKGSADSGNSQTGGVDSAPIGDLKTLLIRLTNANTANAYLDDIYFDPSGANLTNPVPEPSSAVLAAVCCLLAGASRRRRSK